MTNEVNSTKRRDFMRFAGGSLFFAGVLGAGVFLSPKLKSDTIYLRPPGALEEDEFLATCIKCGQCLQVCPYHSIHLLDIAEGHLVGTPYIDARERGCYLCDLLPCVLACPSGALDHATTEASDVEMGMAFLARPDLCLALLGESVTADHLKRMETHSTKRDVEKDLMNRVMEFEGKACTICADLCPYPEKEKAIGMVQDDKGRWYPEVRSECVGCGACEELCPAQETAAIVIIPRKSYQDIYGGNA